MTSESLSQGVLDINYVNNFERLLSALNNFNESAFSTNEPTENVESDFTLLGMINLGTIKYTNFEDENKYAYSATFNETNGNVYTVTYSITGTADVDYAKTNGETSSFTLTTGASGCVIKVGSAEDDDSMLNATLDKSCALTSTNATVEGRTYDTSEAKLFGIIDEVVSAATEYKTSNATTEIAIDDVTVTCTYNSETSTFTGTWSDGSETYSVDVVITPGDSSNNTLVSAKYDDISFTKDAIDSFNAPQFSGSLIAAL